MNKRFVPSERARESQGSDAQPSKTAPVLSNGTPATRSPRVWFVDILRLIASFQMINGHTLEAVMLDSIRQGAFYDRYLWARGLVSVSFLAVAGIAFHLSTLARFEQHKSNPAAVKRRFRRALFIVLVGYLLNLPFGAFDTDPEIRRVSWFYFQTVGVLQCIGTALIVLELMTLAARRASQVVLGSATLSVVCFAVAPLADQTISDGKAHAFLSWISHQGGSLYPLFPWAGFVFAGLVLGAFAMPDAGRTRLKKTGLRLGILAAAAVVLWRVANVSPISIYDYARHHAATSPADSLEKLSAVLGLIIFLAIVSRPIRQLPKLFRVLSSETLTIYAFHLIILYYPIVAIARRFDHALPLSNALLVSAFMLVLTCSYTYAWNQLKASSHRPFATRTWRYFSLFTLSAKGDVKKE